MPVPAGSGAAFFPPSMPSFWNSAAFIHQQQQISAFAASGGGQSAPVTSPIPYQIPLFPPSVTAFPPLIPTPTLSTANSLMLGQPVTSAHQLPAGSGYLGGMQGNPLSPSAAPSPTFPSSVPTPSPPAGAGPGETASGIGKLIWLSSQAGLIKTSGDCGTISFQLKNFCDQAVSDLTCVLRPGFTLKFQALVTPSNSGDQWVATFVAPVHGAETRNAKDVEANLESLPGTETGPPQLPKDPYDLKLESGAIPMLLSIFERNGSPSCQLSLFHCQISNCGDEELYRYVGTSSLKRRQFLERRTHLFSINQSDMVTLVPAALHTTIIIMAEQLLQRGGACLLQELFEHFSGCPEIPLEARDLIGEGKNSFLRFLEAHPFVFSVFPSRVFVSVRRHFPKFDYASYVDQHFGDIQESLMSGDKKMTNGMTNGFEDPQNSGLMNGRRSRFGSNLSLTGLDPPAAAGNPMMAVPPTPTYSLPPATPIWENVGYPTGGVQETSGGGLEFSSGPRSGSWPEPKVGGRIKRFTDVEIQTEMTSIGVGAEAKELRPVTVDAETQTMVQTCSLGCGPDISELQFPPPAASPPDSQGSREKENSLFSLNLGGGGSIDAGDIGRGEGSFDPLFDSMNLMSIGGLRQFSLGD